MVEKVKKISLVGHVDSKDQLVEQLLGYEIHIDKDIPERSYSQYVKALDPFYVPMITKPMSVEEAIAVAVQVINLDKDSKKDIEENLHHLNYFKDIDVDLDFLDKFEYISYGAGYMPSMYYHQIESELIENGIFVIENKTEHICYFLYFTLKNNKDVSEDFLKKHSFVEKLPWKNYIYKGMGMTINQLWKSVSKNHANMATKEYIENALNISEHGIAQAYNALVADSKSSSLQDAVEYKTDSFLVYTGYMAEKDANILYKHVLDNEHILFFECKDMSLDDIPTKLKNNWFVRPFEFLVRGYSLPKYKEFDPTPLIALLYPLFFGIMFGDVGQGFIIFLLGFFISAPLKNIVVTVGMFSMFFGFMYGSIFGFEHVIEPLWLHPTQHIESIIMWSVAMGAVIVTISILINIFQKFKRKEPLLEGANGIIGLCFYLGAVFTGFFGIRLIFILAMSPFVAQVIFDIANRPRSFFVIVIEAFEHMLSYATNTLSFIRIGAIILSHSAMMGAVFMLTSGLNLGTSIFVVGLGNLVVMFVEIMVVAIQSLRLNYYEVFGRFYEGSGKEFVPIRKRV